jgi:hypothetical protein
MALSVRRGIQAPEQATPTTPAAGTRMLYPKALGWFDLNSAGTELNLNFGVHSIEMILSTTNVYLTPAAASAPTGTELFATARSTRNKIDLAGATQSRLIAGVGVLSSTAGSNLKLSYATAENATWASGTGVADAGPAVVVGSTGGVTNTLHDSGWTTLAAGARINDCYLAMLVGSVAMGSTAATISFITCYFR